MKKGILDIQKHSAEGKVILQNNLQQEIKEWIKNITLLSLFLLIVSNATAGDVFTDFFQVNRVYTTTQPRYVYNFFKADISKWDFIEFTNELGERNIEALNLSNMNGYQPTLSTEFGVVFFNALYAGINVGFLENNSRGVKKWENEYLAYKFRKHMVGLNAGYQLLNNRYIIFTPKANIQWNRFRLANFPRERRIPLEDYVSERDLDIRYHQFTGFLGGELGFRLYDKVFFGNITMNVYGGYLYKLHNKPIIRSEGNRLLTDKYINVGSFLVGIGFTVLLPY